jgi:hypothetical protein
MMKTAAAANTTDEEGELVTHDDLLEPQEELSTSREEVAELVRKAKLLDKVAPANYDIDQNIREIRAILKMNAEILDRCVKFMTKSANGWTQKGGKWYASFKRITYDVVVTRSRNAGTQVITYPRKTTQDFETTPLLRLPEGLKGIIVSRNMTGNHSIFIDFEAFFKRSLILHETVLEPFLPKLKEHLMSIQVCLGEIDSWVIQETQENVTFLEETFCEKMEMPDDGQLEPQDCKCETHDPNEICLHCEKKYCDHYVAYYCGVPRRYCESEDLFQCQYYQILKQCNSDGGKFEATFDITNEEGKARLKKFLELMAMYPQWK